MLLWILCCLDCYRYSQCTVSCDGRTAASRVQVIFTLITNPWKNTTLLVRITLGVEVFRAISGGFEVTDWSRLFQHFDSFPPLPFTEFSVVNATRSPSRILVHSLAGACATSFALVIEASRKLIH